ncbi:MAG TPA: hypothetical protein VFR02_07840, partial [bacterium]|nr:hypothetical protein [bacterium]
GTGSYVLAQAKLKGFPVIKTINQYFKQSSDEIDFDQVAGNLGMKDKVFSYTANCTGKVGQARVVGGIDCVKLAYSPDMKVQCDIKQEFVNSDSVKSGLPPALQGQVRHLDWLADSQGNIPVDLKFTGVAAENHYNWDTGRIMKNVGDHVGSALKDQAQDLGKKLQGLFH